MMNIDPTKKEQKIENPDERKEVEPLDSNDPQTEERPTKSDEDGYVVMESGLGIDE